MNHRRSQQPIEALHLPDALLRMGTVTAVTGQSPTSVYRKLAAGTFPQPVRLSARCTRWRAGDITAWLQAASAERT